MDEQETAVPAARSLLAPCRSVAEVSIRSAEDGGPVVMTGHFSVFDTWTEIRSAAEGHFMERIAPGAFAKTFRERAEQIRVLFQHGKDPSIGSKPLGRTVELREDETGAYYEVELFDADYVRELLPALRSGQLGASFQFAPTRESYDPKPKRSEHNPDGIPEVTIREVKLIEFGPVTFGAYPTATAGVRSLTDDYAGVILGGPEGLRALAERMETAERAVPTEPAADEAEPTTAPSDRAAADSGTAPVERREQQAPRQSAGTGHIYGARKETPTWLI